MRRYITRWRGGHRDPAVEAEAQRAYRQVLDEARRERIAELERLLADVCKENVQLKARVRVLEHVQYSPEWMDRGRRARQTLDGPTAVFSGALFRESR